MIRSRMLAAAAIVATVVLGAQTWHKAFRPGGNDLTSYLLSARALWDGQSPYGLDTPFPYIYPLLLAFVLIPLAALPYGAAVVAWFVASVAALGAVLVESAFRRIADRDRRSAELAIAATILITFNIIQNNLLNGQVNLLVVLCCLMSIDVGRVPPSPGNVGRVPPSPEDVGRVPPSPEDVGRVPPSPGTLRGGPVARDFAAGAWLGAAIALKLMPALLLVYFLVRRQFRAIVTAGATALVLALVPALLISGSGAVESGFSRITGVYSQYAREVLIPMTTTPEGPVLAYSVASVVQRVLGSDPRLWIDALCAAGVLGAVAFVDVTRWRRRGDNLAAAAAYMVAIVLISPKSETHHLAFVIPAVALCCACVFAEGWGAARPSARPARRRLGAGGALLLCGVAIVAAPFTGAAEGPMITAAMVFLIAAVTQLPTSCIQRQA